MKRKSLLVPTLYLLALFSITAGLYFTKRAYDSYQEKDINFDNITFVSNNILNRGVPVMNIADTIVNPYSNDKVRIIRYYYNSDDEMERKEKSLVLYQNTYMPNTGIDYTLDEEFDINPVYEGTVVDIEDNELLGKTVKIRHSGEVISVYQGIKDLEVSVGDVVYEGQKIATSGSNKLNESIKNYLHLEIYKNGVTIDPLKAIGKKLSDI